MSAIGQKINNFAATTQQNFRQGFSQFSNTKYVSGTRDFLNSNSLVAKFAFLILVVIVFILCLRVSFQLLNWLFSPSENPYLFNGMLDAQHDGPRTFSSNTNLSKPAISESRQTNFVTNEYRSYSPIFTVLYQVFAQNANNVLRVFFQSI